MILAIDIGNTNIVVGCIDREKTYFIERISTVRTKTELEYAVDIKTILDIYHIKKAELEGCLISSVVPQITNIVRLAAEKILKKEVLVLGPGVKTGLNILMDNPGQLGADLVADAAAGITHYPVPLIIIDMGTATTISVVDEKKRYIGDHNLATKKETSIPALTKALSLLKKGGLLSLCIYSGGDSGFDERDAVLAWLQNLNPRKFLVIKTEYYNRPNHPPVPVMIIRL